LNGARNRPFSLAGIRFAALYAFAQFLVAASPLHAQQLAIKLTPERTRVQFTLGATMHTVHGTFQLKSGAMIFDTSSGKADGRFVVDPASGETGDSSRDARMHADVLESSRYPEIVFTASQVEGQIPLQGDFHVTVHGVLRLHGADHELHLSVRGSRTSSGITASADFVVPYVKWGMRNPSNFLLHVSQEVQIHVEATAPLTPLAEMEPRH
jgi:polyisoprenoid-binding protein YceI